MPAASHTVGTAPAASDAAASLREAPLVRLVIRRDGDAVAAAGVLARALRSIDVPIQVSPTATADRRTERVDAGDPDAVTVAIGPVPGAALTLDSAERPAAVAAVEIATELGVDPDPTLGLAGVVAAGELPADAAPALLERAESDGLERKDGVGLATDDLVDGLTHSTSMHAEFSGDMAATADVLAEVGLDADDRERASDLTDEQRRAVASLVAVTATEGPVPQITAEAVERVLRPHHVADPVPTLEGYADLLSATAVVSPGIAAAHAVGDVGIDAVRSAWREASTATHAALADADPTRYDGVAVYEAGDAPPEIVAALARDARSPEPVALAIGDDAIAVGTRDDDATAAIEAVAATAGGDVDVTARYAVVRDPTELETTTETAIVEAVREER
ncbi:exonuclease [Salinarchaeum laminariae]|uniref:exonuclease n=1 Tax=Salinarchaeum laminariae TaxID=869888 RepID=UPI0020C00434|nr:exonuclease [Salinarchaeum laminariae]